MSRGAWPPPGEPYRKRFQEIDERYSGSGVNAIVIAGQQIGNAIMYLAEVIKSKDES